MNKKTICFRVLSALAVLVLAAGVVSCKDEAKEPSITLHYAGVSDIGPGMTFKSGAPSYRGGKPSDFSIERVKFDNEVITNESFSVDTQTGEILIENTGLLTEGTYKVSVSCVIDGGKQMFEDAFEAFFKPAIPATISAEPALVTIPYDGDFFDKSKTSKIIFTSNSISALGYEIIQEGTPYFVISKTGEISLKKLSGTTYQTPPPGKYNLRIKVATRAGEGIFRDVIMFDITSKPLELAYTPNFGRMEAGAAFASLAPAMVGSDDDLRYSIKTITPATTQIKINPVTGAISVAEGNNLVAGNQFKVDVTITNKYGTADFAGVFDMTVVAFINPISKFSYDNSSQIQGTAFSINRKADFIGDEVFFEFVDLPVALQGNLSINNQTGEITALKSNSIAKGTYAVKVKASNVKNEVTATFNLEVKTNPNFFTKIVYGNNIGVDVAKNASQFRYNSATELTAANLTPTTDLVGSPEVTWSVVMKHGMVETTIDPLTGALTFTEAGYKVGNGGLVLVTATAGKGTPTEYSVTTPVFFIFPTVINGLKVLYTPFVMQVNPREGGISATPEIEGLASGPFSIDYRRTFNYYNIAGPVDHIDGAPSVANSFISTLWNAYYSPKAPNYGSKDPLSYYVNVANTANALLFVNRAKGWAVEVNPNKWMDSYGPANGAFIGQMTYVKDNNGTNVNNGSQIFPLFVWFDEKFSKTNP